MEADLKEIQDGATWQNIYDLLWHIATVRYASYNQLFEVNKHKVWRKKIGTKNKLNRLADKGYLKKNENLAFSVTPKAVALLKTYSDYNTDIIKLPLGKGERDTLYNAQVLLRIMCLPEFFAVFYSEFYEKPGDNQPFLIPDGVLVLQKKGKAKLVFLEIERKKPDWEGHLSGKKWKYEKIAERPETWTKWWRKWCRLLNISHCPIDEFGFTVWCIGDFTADWPGWRFSRT